MEERFMENREGKIIMGIIQWSPNQRRMKAQPEI